MASSEMRRAERAQVRAAYDGTRAGSLFRGDRTSDPVRRRSLGLQVAGGVRIDVYVRCRPMSTSEVESGDPEVVRVHPDKSTVTIKYVHPPISHVSCLMCYVLCYYMI